VCQLYSRTEFTVFLTFGEKKHADKVFGACEVKLCPKSQKKITRINNLRLDFCQLKKHTESRSVLGMYYLALRRAVVNFPNKCPFKKVFVFFTTLGRFLIDLISRTPHMG